jgi:hypothetical protein
VLQVASGLHHLDERALDPSRQRFPVDLLSAEWASSRLDGPRLDQPLRLAHQ